MQLYSKGRITMGRQTFYKPTNKMTKEQMELYYSIIPLINKLYYKIKFIPKNDKQYRLFFNEDLKQDLCAKACELAMRYDKNSKAKFSSYAISALTKYANEIRNDYRLRSRTNVNYPVALVAIYSKVRAGYYDFKGNKVMQENFQKLLDWQANLTQDVVGFSQDGEPLAIEDVVKDATDYYEELSLAMDRDRAIEYLAKLKEWMPSSYHLDTIWDRYGMNSTRTPKTYASIAKVKGKTEAAIESNYRKGMNKLRKYISANENTVELLRGGIE